MNALFCKNLKDGRMAAGLTQKQVAMRLNVVESCYANWEQGRTEPNITILQNICIILGVSADYLIGLENEDDLKQ